MRSISHTTTALAGTLSAEQYGELRAELEMELRRLIPDWKNGDERDLRNLAPRARRRAMRLVDVLRRMDAEDFGVCVSCESPIGYGRLSAIPETTLCAFCSHSREVLLHQATA